MYWVALGSGIGHYIVVSCRLISRNIANSGIPVAFASINSTIQSTNSKITKDRIHMPRFLDLQVLHPSILHSQLVDILRHSILKRNLLLGRIQSQVHHIRGKPIERLWRHPPQIPSTGPFKTSLPVHNMLNYTLGYSAGFEEDDFQVRSEEGEEISGADSSHAAANDGYIGGGWKRGCWMQVLELRAVDVVVAVEPAWSWRIRDWQPRVN